MAKTPAAPVSQQQQIDAMYAANAQARNLVLGNAIDTWQPIFSASYANPVLGQVYNIPVRPVGLIKKFLIELLLTVTTSAAATETQTLTQFGPANIFSNVTFFDLSNYQRINTTGWHLFIIASVKQKFNYSGSPSIYGTAYTNDSPVNAKSQWPVIKAPASYTGAANQTINMFYEVPVAYSDTDLRGAMYAGVVSATSALSFTLNPNFFVASGVDATLAVYQSSTAALGRLTNMVVTVHQNYLDQLPLSNTGPVLPTIDMSVMYLLNQTAFAALNVGQDFPIVYANYRTYLSTSVIFDNAGTLNTGSDVNYWALQTANVTNIFKYDAYVAALKHRMALNNDMPNGTYYFDHRAKPISTMNYGNMQLVLNPSAASAASSLFVGFESLAQANQLIQAGSLAAS